MQVSECSAKPYSFRPAARGGAERLAERPARRPENADPGAAGGSSQPRRSGGTAGGVTSGSASWRGGAAGGGLLGLPHDVGDLVVPDARPGHHARPRPASPRRVMAMTVSCRVLDTPLVVSVLPAQRRLADEVSSAITTQSSQRAGRSARSTSSCGGLRRS